MSSCAAASGPVDPAPIPFSATLLVRDTCFCLHAQRAARAVARRFDEAFRAFGLTSGQFSLLMSLNRPEPPTLGSVARLLAMDRTTLTANLKPLERRGFVRVEPDPTDRRTRRLVLAAPGRSVLAAVFPVWKRVQEQIESALGDPDADGLRAGLNSLAREPHAEGA